MLPRTEVIMKRSLLIALAIAVLWPMPARAQNARAALDAAATALGATNLRSIEFSGRGFDFMFGQAYDPNSAWPRFSVPRYTVTIDYQAPAIRDDRTRMQIQNPPLGGGFQPIVGELRQIWVLNGTRAWNMVGQNAVPAEPERDLRSAVEGRLGQIWLTPQGFVKAALAGNATARTENIRGATKTVISFTALNKFKVEGLLNAQNLVEWVQILFDNAVLGDMTFEAAFSDYKDFGGVKFPTRIVQREGGYPVLDVNITDVKPNAAANIEVPPNIAGMKPPAPHVIKPEKLADGVWSLPVDERDHSIAVEFKDHIVVVEAPDSDELSVPAIDAIKKIIPGKPIRYVINTHTHFDHAGGLRAYAAEGATIVTQRDNIPFYEQVWTYPRTISPDRLAKSGRKPMLEAVVGSRIFSDGSRQLIAYHYAGNMHNAGMLMVYLPKERILIEADSYNPPANANTPPAGLPNLVHFFEAVERLRLNVDQVVPIHDQPAAFETVRRAVETYKDSQLTFR
jgi:glyoxylase-like metal-dependent hydrolase (beta-lactamase superfamily II)